MREIIFHTSGGGGNGAGSIGDGQHVKKARVSTHGALDAGRGSNNAGPAAPGMTDEMRRKIAGNKARALRLRSGQGAKQNHK